MSAATADLMVKILAAILPILTAAGGFISGSRRGSPYAAVNHALDTRKKFVEAGADPQVWDRVLARVLQDVSSPRQQVLERFAHGATWTAGVAALVLGGSVVVTAAYPDATSTTTTFATEVSFSVILACGVVMIITMYMFHSDGPHPYESWNRLPSDSPEFNFTPPKPVELPPAALPSSRSWLPWRRKGSAQRPLPAPRSACQRQDRRPGS